MSNQSIKQTMIQQESTIYDEIRKIYPNSAGLDGIINIERYLDLNHEISQSRPIKILWFLKERAFPSNKKNQEFDVRQLMLYVAEYSKWRLTYGNMCSVTEGILEWWRTKDSKYLRLENLPELKVEGSSVYYMTEEKSPHQIFPLDFTAFLNVQKKGVFTKTSNQSLLYAEYAKTEIQTILNKQFAYINPDIIIFANHIEKLAEDFSQNQLSNFTVCGTCKYYFDSQRNKLFIYTHNPNLHGQVTKEDYCNSIFEAIQINQKELTK